jgi:3-hydroxyacyl-[acyl-carrier-protein] dehydratase
MNENEAAGRTVMDINAILEILPHRPPFLLVDRIVEWEAGKRCVGIKCVTMNEPFFVGHFPGHPVMPGVLIIEALAQVGAVMLFHSLPREVRGTKLVYFTGVDGARFRAPVTPGDVLRLEMTVNRIRGPLARVRGEAFVGDKLVAEADITSMMVDRSEVPAASGGVP